MQVDVQLGSRSEAARRAQGWRGTAKSKYRIWSQGATDRIAHQAYIAKTIATRSPPSDRSSGRFPANTWKPCSRPIRLWREPGQHTSRVKFNGADGRPRPLSMQTVAERLDAWLAARSGDLPTRGTWRQVSMEIGVTPEALYRELARRRAT